ncbi:MAG: ABC-type sugar transport system, substrate-binding protein contains N-terminal xre family [Actinoallomurus sp.]|nr:ABC-type sugar transport system, substrate-binding protein contains N-terminal xre family [Actinoallomurus sp.]
MSSRRTRLAAGVLAALFVLSGCSSSGQKAGTSSTAGASNGATYSAAEVAAATGTYQVKPLFAVPKQLPKKYRLAFLSPGLSYPYFATWSDGMKAAAKFYGVDLDQADLNFKYDTQLDQYKQLAVKGPQVIGSQPMNDATYSQAERDGVKTVLIDGTFKDAPHFGVNDEQVGKLAVDTMAQAAKAKMSGAWKGRKVDVVGLTSPNCAPCDARVKASFAEAEATLGIPAADTTMLTPQGQDPTTSAGSTFNDFLTSHPKDAVLVVSYGDEAVIGSINAAKAANRGGDVLAVSNGGDSAARLALRDSSDKDILVAAIDFQPYAEGWNWVEVAIATAMGKPFQTFSVERVLTSANVSQYYPQDKTK